MESLAVRDPYTLEYVPLLADALGDQPRRADDEVLPPPGVDVLRRRAADRRRRGVHLRLDPQPAGERRRATAAYLTKLKDVKKLDDHTVEFTFTRVLLPELRDVAGSHGDHAQALLLASSRRTQFNEKTGLLMGSGPYKLEDPEDWTPGQPRRARAQRALLGRAADVRPDHLPRGRRTRRPRWSMYGNQEHGPRSAARRSSTSKMNERPAASWRSATRSSTARRYGGYAYVGWNQKRKQDGKDTTTLFADKRVRQAMTMLLDRERIAKEIYLGYATVASGPFAPKGPQSDPDVKPWPYDAGARPRRCSPRPASRTATATACIEGADGKPFRSSSPTPSGNDDLARRSCCS